MMKERIETIYHGTDNDFSEFNTPMIYFTPNAEYAKRYGSRIITKTIDLDETPVDTFYFPLDTYYTAPQFCELMRDDYDIDINPEDLYGDQEQELDAWEFINTELFARACKENNISVIAAEENGCDIYIFVNA